MNSVEAGMEELKQMKGGHKIGSLSVISRVNNFGSASKEIGLNSLLFVRKDEHVFQKVVL